MEKAIIGKKVGMTQIFDEAGKVIPVTVIEAGPCTVVQKKTEEKDGYTAVQLGYQDVAEKKLTKPEAGHLKKAEVAFKKVLKEFKLNNADALNVVKRHGAAIKRMTHGGGPVHRHQGALAAGTYPGRIFKGRDGAGHMGSDQVTVLNLDVVSVDPELNLIAVCGAIPGPKGGIVYLRNSVINVKEKGAAANASINPQKASARVNPQKASARNK